MSRKKTREEITYDNIVKNLLSKKIVLAHILINSLKEFKGLTPNEVVLLIEEEPKVSKRYVHRWGVNIIDFISDKIKGRNTEDNTMNEGKTTYDIIFDAYLPNNEEKIKMIINVEAQYEFDNGYDIETRAIYYCARMLSSQKGVEFFKSDYDNIKKVYSIWICIKCPNEAQNTMIEYSIVPKNIVGKYPYQNKKYDMLSVVIIGLSSEIVEESEEHKLHRLLETFFSPKISKEEKKWIIETEYDIECSEKMERSMEEMCNASKYLIDLGKIEGIVTMAVEYNEDSEITIKRLMQKFNLSEEEAKEEYEEYSSVGK